MNFIQVTIHKMVTTIVDVNSVADLFEAEQPFFAVDERRSIEEHIRAAGERDPKGLWQKTVLEAESVVNEEIELLGVGEANTVCHTCLAPIQVTGKADIVLDPGGFSYSNPTDLRVICSADPDHEIPRDMSDAITKVVVTESGQMTSSTQDTPS